MVYKKPEADFTFGDRFWSHGINYRSESAARYSIKFGVEAYSGYATHQIPATHH